MRLFAISDVHSDFEHNRRLLEGISRHDHTGDALIVAGDVADEEALIVKTLRDLTERFARVFFVPGNHDLWVRKESYDSVARFYHLLEECRRVGVRTTAETFAKGRVLPLYSWYDSDFTHEVEDLKALEGWADYHYCRWPASIGPLSNFFAALNPPQPLLSDRATISFSHFLPRPELLPPPSYLKFKSLGKVCGSPLIERQLREAGSTTHIFGHTHINLDVEIERVRYVQCALGYPHERLHRDGYDFLKYIADLA